MGSGMMNTRFAIILGLNNPEILKINKEDCYHVRILLVLGVICFAKSTNGQTRIIYLLLLRPISNLEVHLAK
jgi:hypothetical protein